MFSNKTKAKLLAAGLGLTTVSAFAALPAGVTDAITAATADGKDLAFALLGLAVAVGVVFWLKRKAG